MTSLSEQWLAELREDVRDSIYTAMGGDLCPLTDDDLSLTTDAVMRVISRRARIIHVLFPQLEHSSGYTTSTDRPT